MAGDIYYNNVSLLLHCDGTNGSTTFTDNSANPKTVTANGSTQISTTQSKFGGASGHLSTSSSNLSLDGSADFSFGTGDFTVEGWVYTAWNGADAFIYTNSSAGFSILCSTTYGWSLYNAGYAPFRVGTLAANTWTHFAASRSSGSLRLFVNGTQVGSTQTAGNSINTGAGFPVIGTSNGFTGYIDDLRVTKGVARYTANFTPPTSAFPNSDRIGTIAGSSAITTIVTAIFNRKTNIIGNIPATVTPTTGTHLKQFYAVTGSIPATLTPTSVMHQKQFYDVTGNIPLTLTPNSPKHRRAHYFLTETVAITSVVAAVLKRYHHSAIVGAIPVTTSVNAVLLEQHRNQIVGSIPLNTTVASAMNEKVVWTAALTFALPTLTATSHYNAPNSITLGFIDTTIEALGGWNATGNFLGLELSSTGTLIETLSAELPLFESTLSASMTVDERITASLGFFESTLTVLGGANASLTFPDFGLSATATSEWNRANASLGFPALALTATGTLEQRMAFAFGFIDTYLSYCSIDVTAPVFSLSASMSQAVSNSVAYVLNVHTQESYQWSNQPWLHIITIGGKPYGVKADGLYLLEGTTDSGTAINGLIKTKSTDFGSFKAKHVPYVYLNSDTATTIKPIVDDVQKTVCASSFGGRKVHLSRKDSGRYHQYLIEGIVKLEGIEWLPEERGRRVK